MNQESVLYRETSGAGTPLVILHGLFGNTDNFRSIAATFEPHFRVIRMDLPGHGQSQTIPKLSFKAMAEAVLQQLASDGITSCHLLGHSLGGKVAMQMAGNSQSLTINKLIIVDIAPRLYPPHHNGILAALKAVPLTQIRSRGDADKHLQSAISDPSVRGFLLKSLQRSKAGEFSWQFDLNGIDNDYELMREPPEFTQTVSCPTLFIKGGNSDYISSQDEQPIRTHFELPSVKVIAGTGHWPHAEKPALFSRLCLEFLQP